MQKQGQKDPLGKEMATHTSILAWKIPWTEESREAYCLWSCNESDRIYQLNNNKKISIHFNKGAPFLYGLEGINKVQ